MLFRWMGGPTANQGEVGDLHGLWWHADHDQLAVDVQQVQDGHRVVHSAHCVDDALQAAGSCLHKQCCSSAESHL